MYKLAQLILTPGQRSATTSDLFVAQPDSYKEESAGILFVLIEINYRGSDAAELIRFINSAINQNYYQNEKLLLKDKISALKVEHIFESALDKTNKAIAEYWQEANLQLDISGINATIGILHANNLYFSTIGKNQALLIHKEAAKPEASGKKNPIRKNNEKILETPKYKITNILGPNNSEEKEIPTSEKLFGSIISGVIPAEGFFIFSNEALPEYLTPKQLIDIITVLPPVSAVEQIKNSLAAVQTYVSFLGLIIKNAAGIQPSSLPAAKKILPYGQSSNQAQNSIFSLNTTEDNTEKLLSPSGMINFSKLGHTISGWLGKISNINPKDKKMFLIKDKIFFREKPSFLSWEKLAIMAKFIRNAFVYIFTIIFYIFKLATNRNEWRNIREKLRETARSFIMALTGIIIWWKELRAMHKFLIVIIILCSGLLSYNIYQQSGHNRVAEEKKYMEELAATIEQKQNQVEADLLYNNQDDAKRTFSEIENVIQQLPQNTEEEKKRRDDFFRKFNEQMAKIRQVTYLVDLKETANLSKLEGTARPAGMQLSFTGSKIYLPDPALGAIFSIDTANNAATALKNSDTASIGQIRFATAGAADTKVHLIGSTQAWEIDTATDEISPMVFKTAPDLDNASALAGYNNKLYLSNRKDNKIYLYTIKGKNITFGQSWMTESNDLSQAVSMDIDGQVYLLDRDGGVRKFLKGKKVAFDLDIVEPALSAPSKIFVSAELDFIYILEPALKRIVIFSKDGKYKMQYQAQQLPELNDFSINEKSGTLYLLSGNIVYSASASHLSK